MVVLAILGDEIQRGAVEGAGTHVADARAKESLTQFVTGLAGEGHGQDLIGRDLFVGHAALNSQGQDVGLSRSGRGANQKSARRRHDRLALFGREPDQ